MAVGQNLGQPWLTNEKLTRLRDYWGGQPIGDLREAGEVNPQPSLPPEYMRQWLVALPHSMMSSTFMHDLIPRPHGHTSMLTCASGSTWINRRRRIQRQRLGQLDLPASS